MKLKMLILSGCVALSAHATSSTELRYDFENGIPSEITLHDVDGNTPSPDNAKYGFKVGTPWVGYYVDGEQNHVAASTSWYTNKATSNDWMVLPALEVSDASALLSWRAMATHKRLRDGYSVYISTTGTDVNDFDTTKPFFTVSAEENAWTRHSLSLADYVGKTIYIAFVNNSTNCDNLFVDDIYAGASNIIGVRPLIPAVVSPYQKLTFGGQVYTDGDESISGYHVNLEIEGLSFDYDQPEAVINPGEKLSFSFDTEYSLTMGSTADYVLTVTHGDVKVVKTGTITSHQKRLVAEELTGMWCGYCVRGIVAFETAEEALEDCFIGIAAHGGDYIENQSYGSYLQSVGNYTGYPYCVLNRMSNASGDPLIMPSNAAKYIYTDMGGCVDLNVEYNVSDNTYTAHTASTFAYDLKDADYRLCYVVKENDVYDENDPDAAKHYYQHNVYALGNDGEMYGYENLPEYITNYHFQDVARGKLCDWEGIEGSLPSDIVAGEAYTHSLDFALPEEVLKAKNCMLVAMLIDGKTGEIINAAETSLPDTGAGIENIPYSNKKQDDRCYNLAGQRINASSAKGIIIVNGKKYSLNKKQ